MSEKRQFFAIFWRKHFKNHNIGPLGSVAEWSKATQRPCLLGRNEQCLAEAIHIWLCLEKCSTSLQ
jgi:hypothetical protein